METITMTKREILTSLGKGISAGIVNITPEQAERMLTKNSHNRALSVGNMKSYAYEMQSGNWMFNGDPIRFASDGTLLDGQTRLTAIIKSGIAQEILVVSGLNKEVFKTIDTGRNRKGADVLTVEGLEVKYAQIASGLISRIIKSEIATQANNEMWYERGVARTQLYNEFMPERHITNNGIVEYYRENKSEITEVINFVSALKTQSNKVIFFGIFTYAFWLLRRINIDQAESFFTSLATGENLEANDPVYRLREKLISIKSNETEKVPPWHYPALIYKSWNAYRLKKPMIRLSIMKTETSPVKPI